MELVLSGLTVMQCDGPVTIELPSYMYPLEPEQLVAARLSDDRAMLALAAGRHPGGNIFFITGDGTIREIDCEKDTALPMGAVTPEDHGKSLVIHAKKQHQVTTSWAIVNSMTRLDAERIRR